MLIMHNYRSRPPLTNSSTPRRKPAFIKKPYLIFTGRDLNKRLSKKRFILFQIQGVPRNLTIVRRLKCRL